MTNNPIPGIFNYCNRWCERCSLSHRCRLYTDEQQMAKYLDNPEASANLFVQEQMEDEEEPEVQDEAVIKEEFVLEEPTPEEMEEWNRRHEEARNMAKDHPAVELSTETGDCMELILQRGAQVLRKEPPPSSEGLNWHQQHKLEGQVHRQQNLLDVLAWYRYFLEVKTMRAVLGLYEEDMTDEPVQNDMNGTAKVVLIGIGHCLKAAQGLRTLLPSLEDELLLLLRNLQKSQNIMNQSFPYAMDFIRPGFDTLGITEDLGG